MINVCEMKFSSGEYELSEADVLDIENRKNELIAVTKTRKAVSAVMVTPYGLKQNRYSGNIPAQVVMADLFA